MKYDVKNLGNYLFNKHIQFTKQNWTNNTMERLLKVGIHDIHLAIVNRNFRSELRKGSQVYGGWWEFYETMLNSDKKGLIIM